MPRILIAGCGDLGTALATRLAARGDEVFGLRRNVSGLPPSIRPLAADLSRPESLAELPGSLDAVFFTAAARSHSEDDYRTTYHDGLVNLLAALEGRGKANLRLVFTSSTSVYAQTGGEWVDEESPANPQDGPSRWLRAAEERVWSSGHVPVVVRLAGIYGPGRTHLVDAVRNGTAHCIPGVFSNRIHRDDAARCLEHLLDLPEPARLYVAGDQEPVLHCELVRYLAARLGAPAPATEARALSAEAAMRGNKRCRSARLVASGFRFQYPTYREGYAALIPAAG